METEREMKFYRIQNRSNDMGRFYLEPNGTGRLEIDGHPRPLKIVEKLPGEPWGKVVADTDREPAGIGANDCPSCHGSGTAISHEPHTHSWPCGLCERRSGREPHEN